MIWPIFYEGFVVFYLCVPKLCFWTNLILQFLHLKFHFDIKGEISFKQSGRNNNLTTLLWIFSYASSSTPRPCQWMSEWGAQFWTSIASRLASLFLSLFVCPQVVFLYKSNIALFAFRFSFGNIGDVPSIQSGGTIIYLNTLLERFCCFYMCVPRLCFWMSLI